MRCISTVILFVVFVSNCFSQEIKAIKVLDILTNKYSTISIKQDGQKVLIFAEGRSSRSNLKEVKDVTGTDSIIVRLDRFVKIVFRIRSGSGEHLRLTKIFCINGGELKECLSIFTSEISYSPNGILKTKYSVSINVFRKDNKFVASLNELDIKNGVVALNKKYLLQFNPAENIFYSQKSKGIAVKISGVKRRIKDYYMVVLAKSKYIFYQSCWYQEGKELYMRN